MWRGSEIWLQPYLRHPKRTQFATPTDVMIAVCDHFEPLHHADKATAIKRIHEWQTTFPEICKQYKDHDDHPPKHTFFYPIEQYDSDLVEEIAVICRRTGSEVDIHLHHDDDTEETLRHSLEQGIKDFSGHSLLSSTQDGDLGYGFIHGNWALDNSDPSGRHCGVQRELQVLKETGCYADFTMPSAPHPTQTHTVNKLYYGVETESAKSHNYGYRVSAPKSEIKSNDVDSTAKLRSRLDHLLLVQGPLGLNWQRRKWGILPRLENADLTGSNPPSPDRLSIWLRNAIHVQHRPDWIFIKLHCHGAISPNRDMLLGEPMRKFHQHLASRMGQDTPFRLHYVSAREMVNIIHAAEDGHSGNPNEYRNYRLDSCISFEANSLPASP